MKLLRLALCVVAWIAVTSFAAGGERVALVIGNGKYDGEAALKNPPNDADAVEAALKNLQFKVTKKIDVDLPKLEQAVVDFNESLKADSVAIFFYAGHGVQVDGSNFLVPLKADIQKEFQVKEKCYKVDQVLAAMEESEAALKIVILDCCRDNPFTRNWKLNRAVGGKPNRGLASIDVIPNGSIIAFSTAPGSTALDGRDRNSPYTAALVSTLNNRPKGGLEVNAVLRATAQTVFREVGQRPWINFDASTPEYFLYKGAEGAAPDSPPGVPPTAVGESPKIKTPPAAKPPVDYEAKIEEIDRDIALMKAVIPILQANIAQEEAARAGDQKEYELLTKKINDELVRSQKERLINERNQIQAKSAKLTQHKQDLANKNLQIKAKQLERERLVRLMSGSK